MGLAASHAAWQPLVAELCELTRVCVVAPDNRGVGESSVPRELGAYRTGRMALDALAVLDKLEWRSAVVAGHSMGGMVAAKLAALAPRRVSGLILVSSSKGGWSAVPRSPRALALAARVILAGADPLARARADVACHYGAGTVGLPGRAEALAREYALAASREAGQPPEGLHGQLWAVWKHGLDRSEKCTIRAGGGVGGAGDMSGDGWTDRARRGEAPPGVGAATMAAARAAAGVAEAAAAISNGGGGRSRSPAADANAVHASRHAPDRPLMPSLDRSGSASALLEKPGEEPPIGEDDPVREEDARRGGLIGDDDAIRTDLIGKDPVFQGSSISNGVVAVTFGGGADVTALGRTVNPPEAPPRVGGVPPGQARDTDGDVARDRQPVRPDHARPARAFPASRERSPEHGPRIRASTTGPATSPPPPPLAGDHSHETSRHIAAGSRPPAGLARPTGYAATFSISPFPVTVVHGREDAIAPPSRGEALARSLRAPLVLLPGGHFLPLEARGALAGLLADALEGRGLAGARVVVPEPSHTPHEVWAQRARRVLFRASARGGRG